MHFDVGVGSTHDTREGIRQLHATPPLEALDTVTLDYRNSLSSNNIVLD